ncbi:hypothetical protein BaRGS_00010585 [Batillaria attramentaria]|uniref:Uncharacterized protein n=1 Tax=Batillaria attramentaria TaxID=370345 RepID=A0ABD0LG49_9CAEN
MISQGVSILCGMKYYCHGVPWKRIPSAKKKSELLNKGAVVLTAHEKVLTAFAILSSQVCFNVFTSTPTSWTPLPLWAITAASFFFSGFPLPPTSQLHGVTRHFLSQGRTSFGYEA